MSGQFLKLVEDNNLDEIKKIISTIDLETKNVALIQASENGYSNMVVFLVENGADIDAQNGQALISALQNGHLNVVQFLVENEADINSNNNEALRSALYYGHLDITKFLVENGADIHDIDDDEPLKWASMNGRLNIVQYLLECGVNPNVEALISASANGHLNVVEFLVEKGVNINNGVLGIAARNNHLNIVKFLVEKGADVNADNNEALIYASRKGYLDIVQFLVASGANPNDEALISASSNGRLNVVEFLIERGVNENRIRIAPTTECSEEIIRDFHFVHICNSGNKFEVKTSDDDEDYFEINGKNPIDPITHEPIPSNLLVSVKAIKDIEYKSSTCFNAEFLYKYWLSQDKSEAGITYKYAANPLTRGYFNQESVNFVIEMLTRLGKI